MIIYTKQITGQGRGKDLGFPTVNMIIPEDFDLEYGIYAGWFVIDHKPYKAALHFGPVPVFNEDIPTLEAHLIDITDENMPLIHDREIELDIVDKIRDIKDFSDPEDLVEQIDIDIKKARIMLK